MSTQVSGRGAVSVAVPVAKLDGTEWDLEIVAFEEEGQLYRVQYPDGFVKGHSASSSEELMTKISSQLKGRYGVASCLFPEAFSLEVGATIKVMEE